MSRSSKLQITEIDGDRYADLAMAQQAALEEVARELTSVIREGIARKDLIVVDGVVKLTDDHNDD
jgi:hypothetical protein